MQALDTALYSKLTEGSTTLYGLVGTRVSNVESAFGAVLPKVIFGVQGGGYDNDTYRDSVNAVYRIKGVAKSNDDAGDIDTAIAAQLHNTVYTVTGWTLVSSMREGDFDYTELVGSVTVFHTGALYRIRISK